MLFMIDQSEDEAKGLGHDCVLIYESYSNFGLIIGEVLCFEPLLQIDSSLYQVLIEGLVHRFFFIFTERSENIELSFIVLETH